jgi:ribonuclease P protein component
MPGTLSFGKTSRLLANHEFQRVYKQGKRLSLPVLTLVYRWRSGGDKEGPKPPRLGLSVSRKVGKSHDRAKVKRRLREIFRIHQHDLMENSEIVIIPRSEACGIDYFSLEDLLMKLFSRAKLIKEAKK